MKIIFLTFLIVCVVAATVMADESCSKGETKQIDCNTCHCANGVWACTRKACIPHRTRRDQVCTPGTTYQKDCNTCVCNKDGTNAACTLKACL